MANPELTNSQDEPKDFDYGFQQLFRNHLRHELLDKETEALLAAQAQIEMNAWKECLDGLRLSGHAQSDLPRIMNLRKQLDRKDTALGRLLASNYRLMLKVAFRYRVWGAKRGRDITDLFSLAFEGFLHAIRKFDGTMNVRLSTYSDHWMSQYIRRELHQQSHLVRPPYNAAITANRILRAESAWRMLNGGTPTDDEVLGAIIDSDRQGKLREAKAAKRALRKQGRYAEAACVVPEPAMTLQKAAQELRVYRLAPRSPVHIEDMLHQPELRDPKQHENKPIESIEAEETKQYVRQAVECLTPIEQRVIRLRFLNETQETENLTLKETGDLPEVGLSRERIRQIQTEALNKLRKRLAHLREG